MRELHILCTFGSNPIGLRRRRKTGGGVTTISSNIICIRIATTYCCYTIHCSNTDLYFCITLHTVTTASLSLFLFLCTTSCAIKSWKCTILWGLEKISLIRPLNQIDSEQIPKYLLRNTRSRNVCTNVLPITYYLLSSSIVWESQTMNTKKVSRKS